MCSIGKKNLIVFITFIYYLHYLESFTNARPEQITPRTSLNITNITKSVSPSERIVTSVRILAKPKIRRGGVSQKYRQQSSNNQAIIFPDDADEDDSIITPIKPYERPSCAKGSTYCEKIDGYPSDLVERMLQVPSPLENLFGIDDGPDEIANRLGDDEDVSLCQTVDRMIFPKIAKTKSNKWKYIINQDGSDKYVQGIRVESCLNPGQPCSFLSNETLGYTSYCKQKYVYRRLISLSEEGQPTTDVFEVPSACCCSYKKIPLDRLSFE
ncbi:protein spaetzle-like [Onthophagus taurus]|uniref:protein spaetzle-like n=1 Tax=Onthophagus taurus TaxID=166361 RepID=UPI0039BEB470